MSSIVCPHCQKLVQLDYRCYFCHNVLPIALSNPFALLDIEPKFDLSKDDIQVALINKLTFYHPDKFVNATTRSKEIATQNAALLNQAAKTLKDDVKRAEILLSTQKHDIVEHYDKIIDQEILMASLELQEEIDATISQKECVTILVNIKKQLIVNYKQLVTAFNQNNFKVAQKLCIERNFLMKSKINIENKLQELI